MRCLLLLLLATTATAQAWQNRPDCGCTVPAGAAEVAFGGAAWPGGVVPYEFAASVTPAQQAAMQAAMQEISTRVNVTFAVRNQEADFVRILDAPSNSSPVGRVGGAQLLHIHNWNLRWVMVHELMHVLGFWHEHQRPGRDQFIAVQWPNVLASEAHHFVEVPTANTMNSAYDFDSLMHFGQNEASSNNQPTIVVLPPNQAQQNTIGQRTQLSTGDLTALRLTYGSLVPPTITQIAPAAVTAWLPAAVVLTGQLFDEATGVRFDSTPITGFTRPAPDQIRFLVPSNQTIGPHQVTVISPRGASQPALLTVTGNDPPVLEGTPFLLRNGFANPIRLHSDNVRTNVLLASLSNQPTTLTVPALQLAIGNQFASLAIVGGPLVGNAGGTSAFNLPVASTAPASVIVYFQAVTWDPQNVFATVRASNVHQATTF